MTMNMKVNEVRNKDKNWNLRLRHWTNRMLHVIMYVSFYNSFFELFMCCRRVICLAHSKFVSLFIQTNLSLLLSDVLM